MCPELRELPPVVITTAGPDGEGPVWPQHPYVPFWSEFTYFSWTSYQRELSDWLNENYKEIATFPDPRNEDWHYIVYLRKDLYDEQMKSFDAPREY